MHPQKRHRWAQEYFAWQRVTSMDLIGSPQTLPVERLRFQHTPRTEGILISLWQKLSDIINRLFPVRPLPINEEALAQLDPDKIYVENVRSLLNVSFKEAEAICEAAARQGLFKKGVEVLCPDGTVGADVDSEKPLPPAVECWVEEEGHLEPRILNTDELKKIIYYRLNSASRIAHA